MKAPYNTTIQALTRLSLEQSGVLLSKLKNPYIQGNIKRDHAGKGEGTERYPEFRQQGQCG